MIHYLYENAGFNRLVNNTATQYGLRPDEVVKDYFMMFVLQQIIKIDSSIILKGGTSLSKGYGITNRFSEDLDLAVSLEEKSTFSKSKLNREKFRNITAGIKATKFPYHAENEEHGISERRNMNAIAVEIPADIKQPSLRKYIKIEEETFSPGFPIEKRKIQSYISNYILERVRGNEQIFLNFPELKGFEVLVQRPERTMIDKVMTIADNYLNALQEPNNSKYTARSRDLYDIIKISDYLNNTNYDWTNFSKLINDVRRERYKGDQKTALSASPQYNIGNLVLSALKENYREIERDYNKHTLGLLSRNDSNIEFKSLVAGVVSVIQNPNWQALWQTTQQIPHQQRKPRER
ncbi:nucleotidyl transferase AbiEii/AbiGii toxin family protein [Limosilactobacillus mucosae]|uniref:nucleotidyl transferase AbiEii/AbiGii toxin family protein n=1 Tax=Limosilactobacillus mucosae TaxID=97478 RepID=UPI00399196B8